MNRVGKGNRLQTLARTILEREGYTVHTAVRTSIRRGPIWISRSNDVWNAFDLLATRLAKPRPLRFVQVTTAKNVSERIAKVNPVPISLRHASVEVWAWHGGRRRLDRRYKYRKVWKPAQFFQVYFKAKNWKPE